MIEAPLKELKKKQIQKNCCALLDSVEWYQREGEERESVRGKSSERKRGMDFNSAVYLFRSKH